MGTFIRALCTASLGLAVLAGCDDRPVPSPTTAAARPTTEPEAAMPNSAQARAERLAGEPWKRISLITLPLTVEAPASWLVQSGPTSHLLLHGELPSGEIDVLMGTQATIKPDMLNLMVKQIDKPATQPLTKTVVSERNGMKIVQQVAPQSVATQDPDLIPMTWTVQFFIAEKGVDYSVYELNVVGLSQAMFEKDEKMLQKIFDSVRYDSAATQPVGLP